ncbi:MAG: hypothetical protein ACREH8_23265 [Opitutaceae bacterium]
MSWLEFESNTSTARVQHVSSGGAKLWEPEGRAVMSAAGGNAASNAIGDDAGGVIVTFRDALQKLRAQRLDPSGALLRGSGGVIVSDSPAPVPIEFLLPDGASGALYILRTGFAIIRRTASTPSARRPPAPWEAAARRSSRGLVSSIFRFSRMLPPAAIRSRWAM